MTKEMAQWLHHANVADKLNATKEKELCRGT